MRKICKVKTFQLIIVLGLLFTTVVNVHADHNYQPPTPEQDLTNGIVLNDNYTNLGDVISQRVLTQTNGDNIIQHDYVLTDPNLLELEAKRDGLEIPEGYRLTKIITSIIGHEHDHPNISNLSVDKQGDFSILQGCPSGICWWGPNYAVNKQFTGSLFYYDNEEVSSSFQGPTTGSTMSYGQTVSSKKSVTVGIDNDYITALLGFEIGETYNVTQTMSVDVPSGKIKVVKAWPYYSGWDFLIVKDYYDLSLGVISSSVEGTGSAYEPNGGARFRQYWLESGNLIPVD